MIRLSSQHIFLLLSLLVAATPTKLIRGRNLLVEDVQVNLDVIQNVGDDFEDLTVPLMFHVPKSGGSSIKALASQCLHLVTADQMGILNGHDQDREIGIVRGHNGKSKYVNVDVTSPEGLDRAKELDFAGSELAEVVITPYLLPAINALFDELHKAAIFTIFRHPIDREISNFYYLQVADWEASYSPELKGWTVMQYAESDRIGDNFIVRSISGNRSGPVTDRDLEYCKKFITEKVWVGLITEFEESLVRFGTLFGWDQRPEWHGCTDDSESHKSNSNKHPKLKAGSKEHAILREKLKFDIALYRHAERTFHAQRKFFEEGDIQ